MFVKSNKMYADNSDNDHATGKGSLSNKQHQTSALD